MPNRMSDHLSVIVPIGHLTIARAFKSMQYDPVTAGLPNL
jgi:hypothetical protein